MSVDEKIVEDEVIYDAREKYDASMPTVDKVVIPDRDKPRIPVLEMKGLGIDFGELTALDDFSLTVGPTEIAGIIGPNGAGKTTLFNLLTKVYQPTRGSFMFDGKDTSGMNTVQISRMGIARTFQNIRLFDKLTVGENIMAAVRDGLDYSLFSAVIHGPKYRKQELRLHRHFKSMVTSIRYLKKCLSRLMFCLVPRQHLMKKGGKISYYSSSLVRTMLRSLWPK